MSSPTPKNTSTPERTSPPVMPSSLPRLPRPTRVFTDETQSIDRIDDSLNQKLSRAARAHRIRLPLCCATYPENPGSPRGRGTV